MIARLVKSWSITQSRAMISLVWADQARPGRVGLVDDLLGGAGQASPSLTISRPGPPGLTSPSPPSLPPLKHLETPRERDKLTDSQSAGTLRG